jgi:hypothetical protein
MLYRDLYVCPSKTDTFTALVLKRVPNALNMLFDDKSYFEVANGTCDWTFNFAIQAPCPNH